MRTKFSLSGLFAVLTVLAILCATTLWLFDSSANRAFDRIPPLFIPTIPMMGVGFALMPFVCLPAFLALVVMMAKTPPRPYTGILFIGLQFAGLFADVTYWGCGIRLIISMLLSLVAMACEQYYRKSLRSYKWILVTAIIMTVCWYIAVICIAASAAV